MVRVVFGNVANSVRLGNEIRAALCDAWARNDVVHCVAGTHNAQWLTEWGAKHVDVACEDSCISHAMQYGPWIMKPWLIDRALRQYGEILFLDFDCRVLRPPNDLMWAQLRLNQPSLYQGTLQALNVGYVRPVCLPIERNARLHSTRRCLNTSVLYCRDRRWTSAWLKAYEDALSKGVKLQYFNDESLLIHAIHSMCGILDAATMTREFEIPIARLKRNTPEARATKTGKVFYFSHR